VQLYRYFVSQSSEFCHHNPLCCFSTSVYCCLFRYQLSPETFGYTPYVNFAASSNASDLYSGGTRSDSRLGYQFYFAVFFDSSTRMAGYNRHTRQGHFSSYLSWSSFTSLSPMYRPNLCSRNSVHHVLSDKPYTVCWTEVPTLEQVVRLKVQNRKMHNKELTC
jgi:hypothetical protein